MSITTVLSKYIVGQFSLRSIPGFPISEWETLKAKYTVEYGWFTGTSLANEMDVAGKPLDKYPVRLNPIETTVLKHATALFGQYSETEGPLVAPVFTEKTSGSGSAPNPALKDLEDIIKTAWAESNGRTTMMMNGISSQIFGGCVFRLRFAPVDLMRTLPVAIDRVETYEFYGMLAPGEQYLLSEAWVLREITSQEAYQYNVKVGENEPAYWIEKWTNTDYEISINGKPIEWPGYENFESKGPNPYGFVPFVYIPHWRDHGIWGTSEVDKLLGLVKEMNLRIADFGDAVSADSHNYVVMKDVSGTPQIVKLGIGLEVISLQGTPSFSGAEKQADMYELHKPSASQPMSDLINTLWKEYQRVTHNPDVLYGEEGGSQRSSDSLLVKAWPAVSHAEMERVFWTDGLNLLTKMMMKILSLAGVALPEVSSRTKLSQNWPAILPKEREALVNEVVNRMSVNLGSPEHLIGMLGDTEDVEGDMNRLKEWLTFLETVKAKVAAEFAPPPPTGIASKGGPNLSGSSGEKQGEKKK